MEGKKKVVFWMVRILMVMLAITSGLVTILAWLIFSSGEVFSAEVKLPPTVIETTEKREIKVFLEDQIFGFYEDGNLIFWGKICSGKKSMKTPKGKFKVLGKVRRYVSKKYGSEMPYAVRFNEEGYFIHVGKLENKPASHGCVRVSEPNAKQIFALAKIGDSISISD